MGNPFEKSMCDFPANIATDLATKCCKFFWKLRDQNHYFHRSLLSSVVILLKTMTLSPLFSVTTYRRSFKIAMDRCSTSYLLATLIRTTMLADSEGGWAGICKLCILSTVIVGSAMNVLSFLVSALSKGVRPFLTQWSKLNMPFQKGRALSKGVRALSKGARPLKRGSLSLLSNSEPRT